MGLLTSLALGLLTVVGLFFVAVHRFLRPIVPVKGKTNIPGTTEGTRWPIIGDALWFYGLKSMKEMWSTLEKLSLMRNVMSFYFGSKLVIFISDAKTAEAVIKVNKCSDKEVEFYHAINKVTNGILSRNGESWADFRRPLDKILHFKKMDDFLVVTADKTKILCEKIGSQCGKGVFHMDDLIKFCTLDITLENVFHQRGDQQIEDTTKIPSTTSMGVDACFARMFKPEFKYDWVYNISREGRDLKKAMDVGRPSLENMLSECRDSLAREGRDPTDPDFEPRNYIEIAIRVALLHHDSEESLVYSFLDMLIAGFDTTSIVISSLFLFLAMHPELQEKVYQEQLEVMRSTLDGPSRDELGKMTYLEMVFNETLRHVSTPIIPRTLTEAMQIDGFIYPEGASLFFNLHCMFHDPNHWERPREFYPDHFLPGKAAKRTRGAFMPFSFGSRGCPGRIYANLVAKFIISMLIRRFKFTTELKFKDLIYKYSLMRESEKGYPLVATKRVL